MRATTARSVIVAKNFIAPPHRGHFTARCWGARDEAAAQLAEPGLVLSLAHAKGAARTAR